MKGVGMYDIIAAVAPVKASAGGGVSIKSELAASRALCAAFNSVGCLRSGSSTDDIKVRFACGGYCSSWSRDARDDIRRMLDRALVRIDPPVDARTIARPGSLKFLDELEVELTLNLESCATMLPSCRSFTVEGVSYHFDEACATQTKRAQHEDKTRKKVAWLLSQYLGCEWLQPQTEDPVHATGAKSGPGARRVAPQAPDVFAFVRNSRNDTTKRATHVEPRGVAFTGIIVAVTEARAIIAVRSTSAKSGLEVVGQIPVPSSLAKVAESAKALSGGGRKRGRDADEDTAALGPLSKLFLASGRTHHKCVMLADSDRYTIEVKSYRLHVSKAASDVSDASAFSIEVDDVVAIGAAESVETTEGAAHKTDLISLVRSSCVECLRASEVHLSAFKCGSVAQRLRKSMLDTTAVSFTKDKKTFKQSQRLLEEEYPLKPHAAKAVIPVDFMLETDETSTIEFKSKASEWSEGALGSGNRERLRHALAAFANTFGGYLVIGVGDDGRVLGVSDEETQVRTAGFCPPMFAGAIEGLLHKVRAPGTDGKSSMPTDWWKSEMVQPSSSGANKEQDKKRLVMVYRVLPGSAPFYTPARYTVPSMRGFCSTLRMPVRVCCTRIEKYLPSTQECVISSSSSGDLSAAALAAAGFTLSADAIARANGSDAASE